MPPSSISSEANVSHTLPSNDNNTLFAFFFELLWMQVLSFFDLDCVCVGYNGSNVVALPRFIRAVTTGYNFIEPAKLRCALALTFQCYVKYRNCVIF